ncbi:MAG TPA: ABC transporter ATP-binding protein [Vicinamibacterales bacterium]|nr:ABC transporter ATP-binding protein [Vicinamibacterales bacterium]
MSVDFLDLSIRELSRNFARRRALSRVTFDCRAGEIVGLLGPNGAGKSTLLSIVSTLMSPSSGDVRYGTLTAGEGGADLRSRLGVLSHDLHLYSELTARENLAFFAALYDVADADARIARALDRARLADRADDTVQRFSRGMRQRLALERALLHAPRLLLLDEPFTGLDDRSTQTLIERLGALKAEGCITLLATHDLDVAEAVLDRAVVLNDGRLVAVETDVKDLRRRYRAHVQRPVHVS